jgi:hypothetical protein
MDEPCSIAIIRERLRLTDIKLTFRNNIVTDEILTSVATYLPALKDYYVVSYTDLTSPVFELRDAVCIESTQLLIMVKDNILRYVNEHNKNYRKYCDSHGNTVRICTPDTEYEFENNKLVKLKYYCHKYELTIENKEASTRHITIDKIIDVADIKDILQQKIDLYKKVCDEGSSFLENEFIYKQFPLDSYPRMRFSCKCEYKNVNLLDAILAVNVLTAEDTHSYRVCLGECDSVNVIEYNDTEIIRSVIFSNKTKTFTDEAVFLNSLAYERSNKIGSIKIIRGGNIPIKRIDFDAKHKIMRLVKYNHYHITYGKKLVVDKIKPTIDIDLDDIKLVLDNKIPVTFKYI